MAIRVAARKFEAARDACIPHLAIAEVCLRPASVEFQAFELASFEIDDPAYRIGAIHGRGAPAHDLHALNNGRRDQVDVNGAIAVRGHDTFTVQQDERAPEAQSAEIHDGLPGRVRAGTIICVFRHPRHELRKRVEHGPDARRAVLVEQRRIDGRNRAGRLVISARDARAGDDNLFKFGVVLSRAGCARLGEHWLADEQREQQQECRRHDFALDHDRTPFAEHSR